MSKRHGQPGLFDEQHGVGKAWVSSLVPANHRGRAQGVFQALNGGAILVAGLWAGLLWNARASVGTLPLLVSGVGGLVAALALITFGVARQRTSSTR